MRSRFSLKVAVLLMVSATALGAADVKPASADGFGFEQHIRPLLESKCLKCHGESKQEANLRLDSLETMLKGGDSGPAIVRGDPKASLLIEAIKYESLEMPPTGPLPENDIQNLEAWIASGAPWPEHDELKRRMPGTITDTDRQWWAFRPLSKPQVPTADGDDWSRNEIDRFIYWKLAQHGMRPAPRADKTVLVRRVYFDLIGLPPSPEQIDKFVHDDSPGAWESLIDSLLATGHYGEHWARYWLDVVRYAESDGWNQDAYRPDIWRYRDYVVHALNTDKPYPEFVRQQLAGDEIPGDNPENMAATGFLRLGIYEYNQRDAKSHWNDIINELTDVVGDVFLGVGMACARCHDHKFDPLLQRDYFRLRAFFEPMIWRDDVAYATEEQRAEYEQQIAAWKQATKEIRTDVDALLKPYNDRKWRTTVDKFPLDIQACFNKPVDERTSWEHQMAYLVGRQFLEEGGGPLQNMDKADEQKYEALKRELAEFDSIKPDPLPALMTAADFPGPISPTVIPGDPGGTPVQPGFPSVLEEASSSLESVGPESTTPSGRRTALAEWIGEPDNPLTTRVIVNRIWQQHFGRGLVTTASDFGHRGERPTHPELLDWLTANFVEQGWSIKKLHKMILMSATWQQSTDHSCAGEYQQLDFAERLLWRARIRRLSAEQIRDAMLSVSGELRREIGGPSVEGDTPRRSLYLRTYRNTPDEFLHAFDVANGLKSVAQRDTTTTPTQALLTINGDYCVGRAKKLAERLVSKKFETAEDLLTYAVRLTWAREPTPAEMAKALRFVGVASDREAPYIDDDRLVDFCHVLLNSNEFLYID